MQAKSETNPEILKGTGLTHRAYSRNCSPSSKDDALCEARKFRSFYFLWKTK